MSPGYCSWVGASGRLCVAPGTPSSLHTVERRKPPIYPVFKENSAQGVPGTFSFLSAFTLFGATLFSLLIIPNFALDQDQSTSSRGAPGRTACSSCYQLRYL